MKKPTKLRKTPVQFRSRQTVEAIIEACARILVREGYSRMTTNRVADVAGVSIGSLYQYFSCKDAVLVAVFERHQTSIRDAIGAEFDDTSDLRSYTGTRRLIEAVIRAHMIDPKLHARLEYLRREGVIQSALGEDHLTFVAGKLEVALERDFPDTVDDPRRAARMLVTVVHALIEAFESGEFPGDREDLATDISALVFRYVQGK